MNMSLVIGLFADIYAERRFINFRSVYVIIVTINSKLLIPFKNKLKLKFKLAYHIKFVILLIIFLT
jgi:hypothetical protein